MRWLGQRLQSRWAPLLAILAIVGPGIITANVDNDAGGIATYSLAGGNFGYRFIWSLLPVGVLLFVIQEMASRLGAVTRKGLADLIRERFGLRITFWLLFALLFTNLANTMGEFAGVASAGEIFGLSRYIAVPVAAALVWLMVVRGSYRSVEKVFLVACLFYVAYPISGFLARPDWSQVWQETVRPQVSLSAAYVTMLVGIVGTTIAPWMQFYQQAAVVDKGLTAKDLRFGRIDVLVGCVGALIVVFFIIVTCAATIHAHGQRVDTVGDAAEALRPLAGPYCAGLFALGLLNASLFAASILPLATAYQLAEGIGWERGLDRPFRAAPQFYLLYTALIVVGAGLVLLPGAPLLRIMLLSQVMNGLLLPVILVLMLLLATRRSLMGELVMSKPYAIFCWGLTVLLIVLDAFLLGSTLFRT